MTATLPLQSVRPRRNLAEAGPQVL